MTTRLLAGRTFVLIVLALTLLACGGPGAGTRSDLQITVQTDPPTPQVGGGVLVVTVTGQDGEPVDDATLAVEGNMTHAGMVPVIAHVDEGEGGAYRVPFTWSMGGDWVITVTARAPDGRQAQADFRFTVEGD